MSAAQRFSGFALLLIGLGVGIGGAMLQAGAQTTPLEVTTDTPDYCQRLSNQVDAKMRAMASPPPEAVHLSGEGTRLCGEGQVRGGILRLRRALLMIVHPEDPDQPTR
jgi:hypothetical protein